MRLAILYWPRSIPLSHGHPPHSQSSLLVQDLHSWMHMHPSSFQPTIANRCECICGRKYVASLCVYNYTTPRPAIDFRPENALFLIFSAGRLCAHTEAVSCSERPWLHHRDLKCSPPLLSWRFSSSPRWALYRFTCVVMTLLHELVEGNTCVYNFMRALLPMYSRCLYHWMLHFIDLGVQE